MTTEELSNLAKAHADAILSGEYTRAELVMLMACIQARVEATIAHGQPTGPVPVTATPLEKPKGAVIASKGYPCVCVMCAKQIYTVNKDIYENSTVADFIASFTPMPGYPAITRKTKISNMENNISTDCPACSAELSLYLAGKQI